MANNDPSVPSYIEYLDTVGTVALMAPKINKLPGAKGLGKLLLVKQTYDLIDYIGEKTKWFDLTDSDAIIKGGANAVANLFGLSLTDKAGAKDVTSVPEGQNRYLLASVGNDPQRAQRAINEVREQAQKIVEPVKSIVAWTIFHVWQIEARLACAANLVDVLDLADLVICRRFLSDIPLGVFTAGAVVATTWLNRAPSYGEAKLTVPELAALNNPFKAETEVNLDRILAPLAAARTLQQ